MAKILIVDDYPAIRELLAEELAAEGNIVATLGGPESVVEEIGAFAPDVVILDLFFRGKCRWELLGAIKDRHPALPVILYSGTYPQEGPHLSRSEGFVMKSSLLDELKQAVNRILEPDACAVNL